MGYGKKHAMPCYLGVNIALKVAQFVKGLPDLPAGGKVR